MVSHTGNSFLIQFTILLSMQVIVLNFHTNQQGFESGACEDLNRLFKPSDY